MNLLSRGWTRFFRRKPSTTSKEKLLSVQGEHYDLQTIYNRLNTIYFDNQLNLQITWFGNARREAKRHRKLGLFCFDDKLIKIHRLLDHPNFPPYFISYVVYHEMLHSVCPPKKRKNGRYQIHHFDFKSKEREFAQYREAKQWEERNKKMFFSLN